MNDVIDYYLSDETIKGINNSYWDFENAPGLEKIKVKSAYIQFEGQNLTVNTPFDIITEFWCLEEGFPVHVSMLLYDMNGQCVFNVFIPDAQLERGLHKAVFHIPGNLMNDGIYYVSNMFVSGLQPYFYHEHAHSFEIKDARADHGWYGKWIGSVRPDYMDRACYLINKL